MSIRPYDDFKSRRPTPPPPPPPRILGKGDPRPFLKPEYLGDYKKTMKNLKIEIPCNIKSNTKGKRTPLWKIILFTYLIVTSTISLIAIADIYGIIEILQQ